LRHTAIRTFDFFAFCSLQFYELEGIGIFSICIHCIYDYLFNKGYNYQRGMLYYLKLSYMYLLLCEEYLFMENPYRWCREWSSLQLGFIHTHGKKAPHRPEYTISDREIVRFIGIYIWAELVTHTSWQCHQKENSYIWFFSNWKTKFQIFMSQNLNSWIG